MLFTVSVIDKNKDSTHHTRRQKARNEQVPHGLVTGNAIQNQGIAGRHDNAEPAGTAGKGGRIIFVITFLDHHGYHDGSNGSHGSRCGT